MERKENLVKSTIESPKFYDYLLSNIRLASVLVLDENGIVLKINEGLTMSFGYTPEDVKGRYFSFLFIPEDIKKNKPEAELQSVLESGDAEDRNYIVHKNGSYLWTYGESIYTQDVDGNVYIIKLIYELSREKELEKSLRKANEEVQRVNESLSRMIKDLDNFVYTASHDLKAPINNIQALIATLEEELSEESKKNSKEILGMIHASIEKFQHTLADLTVAGRVQEVGNKDKDTSELNFGQLLEDVKINLHEEIINSEAVFTEDFGKAPSINFSRKNLRSILQNLISNAIKYRSPERRPEIKIETEKTDGYLVLKVSDNGLGIKEEDKGKVFEMYQRLHTHVEGTGVGMSIIARVMENAGGRIEIESEVGKGSTFKVYFKE